MPPPDRAPREPSATWRSTRTGQWWTPPWTRPSSPVPSSRAFVSRFPDKIALWRERIPGGAGAFEPEDPANVWILRAFPPLRSCGWLCHPLQTVYRMFGADGHVRGRPPSAGLADDREAEERSLVGETLLDRWRIVRLLGAGGMSMVYEAEHRNGARVAIKVLNASLARNPRARERFLREGRVANSVDHPNVGARAGRARASGWHLLSRAGSAGRGKPCGTCASRRAADSTSLRLCTSQMPCSKSWSPLMPKASFIATSSRRTCF